MGERPCSGEGERLLLLVAAMVQALGLPPERSLLVAAAADLLTRAEINVLPKAAFTRTPPPEGVRQALIDHINRGMALSPSPAVATVIAQHHNRLDGCGYVPPSFDGAPPLEAQILGLAEAYVAFLGDTPLSPLSAAILSTLREEGWTTGAVDPAVVKALFLAIATLSGDPPVTEGSKRLDPFGVE